MPLWSRISFSMAGLWDVSGGEMGLRVKKVEGIRKQRKSPCQILQAFTVVGTHGRICRRNDMMRYGTGRADLVSWEEEDDSWLQARMAVSAYAVLGELQAESRRSTEPVALFLERLEVVLGWAFACTVTMWSDIWTSTWFGSVGPPVNIPWVEVELKGEKVKLKGRETKVARN